MLPTKPRVLIVDDEKDNLQALNRLLRKDFEVELASSGPEALKVLDAQPSFDCVLSDQRMPEMTGSELFERIREQHPWTTRLLISGFSDLEAVIDAVNRGEIWKYIAKPWEPSDLQQTLKAACERSRLRRELEDSRIHLQRAALELRAKDWARERLLQILLHEFRHIPQILDNVAQLEESPEHTQDRLRFLERARSRIDLLKTDIESLLQEEKDTTRLPKEPLSLPTFLETLLQERHLSLNSTSAFAFHASAQILRDGLLHLVDLFLNNQSKAPLKADLDVRDSSPNSVAFLSLSAKNSSGPIYPKGFAQAEVAVDLAWKLALEPFVGAQDFHNHGEGLRLETARHIRRLSTQGVRVEFSVDKQGTEVAMVLAFTGT